jgi:transcriptional regulator with XRE-family HTH domain
MTLYYIRVTLPATMREDRPMLTDDEFRARLREILGRSGLSMRALSASMGRDPGYVAALLDPSRPSRARPTPADLVRASDATGIPFVELLEALWGIEPSRLADELAAFGFGGPTEGQLAVLSEAERASLGAYVAFLVAGHAHHGRRRTSGS